MNAIIQKLTHGELLGFNLRNRDQWVTEQARTIPSGANVLDAGAGSSPYRAAFAHCDYRTQDFAQLRDDQLRDSGYGAIDYVCDITSIPVTAHSFDAVLCTEVLEHHSRPIEVVRELARVLKAGGTLLLTAPLGSGIHQEPYHFYGGYTPYWYEKFLSEAGFEDISVSANGGTLRHIAQEGIRFLQLTRPFGPMLPSLPSLLFLPVWLLLLPFLLFVLPISAKALDAYDKERRFTVGYHVRAKRKSD